MRVQNTIQTDLRNIIAVYRKLVTVIVVVELARRSYLNMYITLLLAMNTFKDINRLFSSIKIHSSLMIVRQYYPHI